MHVVRNLGDEEWLAPPAGPGIWEPLHVPSCAPLGSALGLPPSAARLPPSAAGLAP